MHVRTARVDDAESLSTLLNAIIDEGDKTAIDTPLSGSEFAEWFITGKHCVSCVVGIGKTGEVLGFQAVERFHDDLPEDLADIATFVSAEARGTGVGRALAEATLTAATDAGLESIRAVIRRQNDGAIRYYRSIGFDDEGDGRSEESVTLTRAVSPRPA